MSVNDLLLHIPVFNVFWQMGAAVFGGIVFEEYNEFDATAWALYIVGVLIMFCGIYVRAPIVAPPPSRVCCVASI